MHIQYIRGDSPHRLSHRFASSSMTSDSTRPDPFATLNAQQRDAVEHGLDASNLQGDALLVIAGAGTGKTLTLASRVARLVLAGADPQRILLLTFSRRAALEMERRAGRLLHQALTFTSQQRPPALPWSGTFHSIGARLLREYAPHVGLSESFTILDRGDAEDLLGVVRQQLGFGQVQGRSRFPQKGTCLAIYSRAVNSQGALRDLLLDHYPWCAQHEDDLKRLFAAYVAEKQRQGVLDFDDLLLWWSHLMAEPVLCAHVAARFDHVLVDEYQDTNNLQEAILLGLKADGRGLTVVGDDAQSIYGFRAAEVRNILDFPGRFAAARVVTLERNYRSTQPILDVSNAAIALAPERHRKTLWTEQRASERPQLVAVEDELAQARWVADKVLEHREAGLKLKTQAVLFRAAHHSAALELELARRNIPFVKFGGLQFLEAAHVKDVLAVLRWVENPRSRIAGFRVAQLVPGIGAATATRLLDAMDADADPAAQLQSFEPPSAARLEWQALAALYGQLRTSAAAWPEDVALVNAWYQPHLERLHDDARIRQADLTQLARIAHASPSRQQFLTELTLDPPSATSDEAGAPLLDEDYLILSTIHSAKGMEWQSVHVLNAVDGCIPSDMSTGSQAQIEEERRLLYVALTRARRHLQVLVPQRFYVSGQSGTGDRHVYGTLSRFLPQAVTTLFEQCVPDKADPATTGASRMPTATFDVAARLRGQWA
jgi:DNA helicase-2/ATP-dependent DNA helicase PcrA